MKKLDLVNNIPIKRKQLIRSLPVEFVFLTLPYKEINLKLYRRESDKAILSITSGYNELDQKYYGIPYGVYPRLILYYICSEVKRTKSKEIILGKSVQDILERMSVTENGVRNDGKVLKSFKEQLLRLTNASIKVTHKKDFDEDMQDFKIKTDILQIVKSIEFWQKSEALDYKLVLTQDFFDYLMNSSATVFDAKILTSIKSSPISLDLYILLNYKSHLASKYQKDMLVSFKEIHNYFGTKDAFRSFKQNIKKKIEVLLEIYPDLNISVCNNKNNDGILIKKESLSTVQPDLFSSNYL